jgi:hypothetical protein
MTRVLIVTYDLIKPGQNYEKLIQRIKQYGEWARLGGSSYLISTANSPVEVRNYLSVVLDQNDKLWVGVAPAPSAWHGLPNDVSNWILSNQK